MAPNVNEIINDLFLVKDFLGSGASGGVYLVVLTRDWNGHKKGSKFALKFYSDQVFEREEESIVYARRVREATLGNKVDSRHVLKTYDTSEFWVDGDKPKYLLMEYIDGEQLDIWVKKQFPLPIEQVYDICLQVSRGLRSLHVQRIVHRDVKAPNVIITRSGRLVLLDLGVIRPLAEGTITGSQSFLGTLRFGAPEWLIFARDSAAADVYSLGTIFYLLLNGHDIFPKIDLFSRLVIAVDRDVPEVKLLSTDVRYAYLAELVARMLAKEPAQRPTLDEVIGFLKKTGSSPLWQAIRSDRLHRLLPNLRGVAGKVLTSETNSDSLDHVLANMDRTALDKLLDADSIRAGLSELSSDSSKYSALPEAERAAWVKKAFALIDVYDGPDDGAGIEAKWHLASKLREIESSPLVLTEIRPTLDDADAAMTEMIQVLRQENPDF